MSIPELFLQEIEQVRSGQRDGAILIWRGMPLLISRATAKDVEPVKGIIDAYNRLVKSWDIRAVISEIESPFDSQVMMELFEISGKLAAELTKQVVVAK